MLELYLMKLKSIYVALFFIVTLSLTLFFNPSSASAQIEVECSDGSVVNVSPSLAASGDPCGSRGGTRNNSSGQGHQNQSSNTSSNTSTGQSDIDEYLATGVNILSAVAGLAITGSIVVGGLQYASAGGNSAQVSSAKNRILVSVASLLMLGFGYAILQWIIPGGAFNQ